MASTVEYGTYIIDLATAMLENPGGLTNAQSQRILVIRRQAVNFLTDYMRHESSALPDLLSYLTKDAVRPLSMLVNSCDMILNGSCGLFNRIMAKPSQKSVIARLPFMKILKICDKTSNNS